MAAFTAKGGARVYGIATVEAGKLCLSMIHYNYTNARAMPTHCLLYLILGNGVGQTGQ